MLDRNRTSHIYDEKVARSIGEILRWKLNLEKQ